MPAQASFKAYTYLRLRQIVQPHGLLPLSASTWWRLVRSGRVSAGILLSPGCRVWKLSDVLSLVDEEVA